MKLLLLSLCLIATSLDLAHAGPAQKGSTEFVLPKPDRVIASIDNEPITLRDLEDYQLSGGVKVLPEIGSDDFKKFYEEYLVQVLVEKEASSIGINVSDEDVDSYINEIKNQNHIDDAQLEQLLKGKGLLMPDYRKQIYREILRTRLTQHHARATISVSDEEIERHLGVESEDGSEELHLFQVFVPVTEDGNGSQYQLALAPTIENSEAAREERKKIADDIQAKAANSAELRRLGGVYFSDLGVVNAEDLLPEFREAVEDLSSADDVSAVIESERGYYIFALGKVSTGSDSVSQEARDKARKELFDLRLRNEMESFIMKELPKKHNLEKKL